MKKMYITPASLCVKINKSNIICTSVEGGEPGNGRSAQTRLRSGKMIDFSEDSEIEEEIDE